MFQILFSLIFFSLNTMAQVSLPTEADHPGNSQLTVPYQRVVIKTLNRDSYLYIPQRSDGVKAPLVVFGHGQALDESAYDKTLQHIASKGAAALFVQYDNGFFDQNWARMASDFNEITRAAAQDWPDQIDKEKIIYTGHSKGGYVALMAAGAANKPLVSSLVLVAPADYNKEYLKKIDPQTAVTLIIGENDQVIKISAVEEIYKQLSVKNKQFITVRSYSNLSADHYFPLNKRFAFGGQNGTTAFHHHGLWKWFVAAAWDAEDGGLLTQPYLYGDQASSSGDPNVVHNVVRNFKPRSEYLVKVKAGISPLIQLSNLSYALEDLHHQWSKIIADEEQLRLITRDPAILTIGKNYKINSLTTPNDLSSSLWHLNQSDGHDINALNAWKLSTGSNDVVVAVIDSGIKINHSDLKDNIWTNLAEKNGTAGVDDDGNGYIDDIHGYNFATKNPNPDDSRGHGTLVSGLIGAQANNNQGIVGVSWDVSLMALNMFPNLWGNATLASAVEAIDYATQNGAQIINASWGSVTETKEIEGSVKILFEAVERAEKANVLFVAAAGNSAFDNDEKVMVPATLPNTNIVSVGAVNQNAELWSKSNYGLNSVHVLAPGEEVTSLGLSGGTTLNSGTSLSAPIVSGIVVLMLSLNPELTPLEIRQLLIDSCRPQTNLSQKSQCGGFIDAEKVLLKTQQNL